MLQKLFLSAALLQALFIQVTFTFSCTDDVPSFDFDYAQWSGKFRYTLYQSSYIGGYPPADCQLKYWEQVSDSEMFMNKTYRYFDGSSDVTDSFTGQATQEGSGKWLLKLSQGDVYHIAMLETDYETYAAYVECNEDQTQNYAVISATTPSIDAEKVAELTEKFLALGADMEVFSEVVHDANCKYYG